MKVSIRFLLSFALLILSPFCHADVVTFDATNAPGTVTVTGIGRAVLGTPGCVIDQPNSVTHLTSFCTLRLFDRNHIVVGGFDTVQIDNPNGVPFGGLQTTPITATECVQQLLPANCLNGVDIVFTVPVPGSVNLNFTNPNFTINANGQLQFALTVTWSDFSTDTVDFIVPTDQSATPEPATLVLFLTAVPGLYKICRRR